MSPKQAHKSSCTSCGRHAHTVIAGLCRSCKKEQ